MKAVCNHRFAKIVFLHCNGCERDKRYFFESVIHASVTVNLFANGELKRKFGGAGGKLVHRFVYSSMLKALHQPLTRDQVRVLADYYYLPCQSMAGKKIYHGIRKKIISRNDRINGKRSVQDGFKLG